MRPPTTTTPPAAPLPPPAGAAQSEAELRDHRRAVWTYLRMLGAAPGDADDLTQEALLVLVRQPAPPEAPRAFLLRTARNLFLGDLRRQRRAPEPRGWVEAVDRAFAEQAEQGSDWIEALERCRSRLPRRHRRALHLYYSRGLGLDEAAPALGLRPNGLKTLLQRVRATLRRCLEESLP